MAVFRTLREVAEYLRDHKEDTPLRGLLISAIDRAWRKSTLLRVHLLALNNPGPHLERHPPGHEEGPLFEALNLLSPSLEAFEIMERTTPPSMLRS